MKREEMVARLTAEKAGWDVVIIGGGATGLGCAVDAASRGYRTALFEQGDFAQETSSRSTKLIHGGVRYLQQGNIKLVRESLRERGLLLKNAPHLVKPLAFIVPVYKWWEPAYYASGLKVYDVLAGKLRIERSQWLSRAETLRRLPGVNPAGLRGGVLYFDAQFDDARLAIALAQTAAGLGAVVLNYFRATGLVKSGARTSGVLVRDVETGTECEIPAKVVINATGVLTDSVRRLDEPAAPQMIAASRGAHIVVASDFLPGDTAVMVPRTDDGRVLFAIPWHGRVLIGTTDTPADPTEKPRATPADVDYLLKHAARYLARKPERKDILSTFAGLRPLVGKVGAQNTALVPRDHTIVVSASGLVTITGGKWTTYRKMGEETLNKAAQLANLPSRPSQTADIPIHNAGSAEAGAEPTTVHAVRQEMARTVTDVLARRTRDLFLDVRTSLERAPQVAAVMMRELGRDEKWRIQQLDEYGKLARECSATDL